MSVLTILYSLLLGAQDGDGKLPVPDPDAQARSEKLIREVFQDDYGRKTGKDQRDFARRLLTEARKPANEPTMRYVLYRESLDFASHAGDVETLLEAIRDLGRLFAVDVGSLRKEALETAAPRATSPADRKAMIRALMESVDDLLAREDFDAAEKITKEAYGLARRMKDVPAAAQTRLKLKDIAKRKKDAEKILRLRRTHAENPEDVEANRVLGTYDCLVRGNWEEGLKKLAKGGEDELSVLARKDLAGAEDAKGRIAIADGWWRASEERESSEKAALQSRAAVWYRKALPDSSGLSRLKITKRLEELGASVVPPKPASTVVPHRGLVGSWSFEEGNGAIVRDSSGNDNHGTLVGGIRWTEGRVGKGILLDGADDFVSCGVKGMPQSHTPKSVACWFTLNTSTPRGRDFVTFSNVPLRWSLQIGTRRQGLMTVWAFGGRDILVTQTPKPGTWHHLAYTYDGTTHRLYLNGKEVNSSTMGVRVQEPSHLEFGRMRGYGEHHDGKLDEIYIYSRALSAEEVARLAKVGG